MWKFPCVHKAGPYQVASGTRWLSKVKKCKFSLVCQLVEQLVVNKVGKGHPEKLHGSNLPTMNPHCSARKVLVRFSSSSAIFPQDPHPLFLLSSAIITIIPSLSHLWVCDHHVLHPQTQRPYVTKPRTSSSSSPSKHRQPIRCYYLTNASTNRCPNHQPNHRPPLERARNISSSSRG